MPFTTKKFLIFEEDDLRWFQETYPKGSLNWLITLMLKEFRKAHGITPADYAAIGARELKKQLETGDDKR